MASGPIQGSSSSVGSKASGATPAGPEAVSRARRRHSLPGRRCARPSMGGGRVPGGRRGARVHRPPPCGVPLPLAGLQAGRAFRKGAGRCRAQAVLVRERAEQVLLGRGDQVKRRAGNERRLDVAHHQSVLAGLTARRAVLLVEELPLPGPGRNEDPVVPQAQRAPRPGLDPHPSRHALHRGKRSLGLTLDRPRLAAHQQRANCDSGLGAGQKPISDGGGVMSVDQEQRFLEPGLARPVAPHRPGIEPEVLEQAVSGRPDRPANPEVGAELEGGAIGDHALVELEERRGEAAVRGGHHEVRVGAARMRASGRPRGGAAESVGDQPLAAERPVQVGKDVLSQAHTRVNISLARSQWWRRRRRSAGATSGADRGPGPGSLPVRFFAPSAENEWVPSRGARPAYPAYPRS